MAGLSKIKVISGLGNPGPKFRNTYHNVGFLGVDFFVKGFGAGSFRKDGDRASFSYAQGGGFTFVKPLLFMNRSGAAVSAALRRFRVRPEHLLVLHDDSDIALGSFKTAFGRGSAGHRGVASILEALGTKNFWRIRIGIRGEARVRIKAERLVLVPIREMDKAVFYSVFSKVIRKLNENENG